MHKPLNASHLQGPRGLFHQHQCRLNPRLKSGLLHSGAPLLNPPVLFTTPFEYLAKDLCRKKPFDSVYNAVFLPAFEATCDFLHDVDMGGLALISVLRAEFCQGNKADGIQV